VSPAPVMAQVTMTSVFMDGSCWVRLRLLEIVLPTGESGLTVSDIALAQPDPA